MIVGLPVSITCPIEGGNPPPTYQWKRYNDIDQYELLSLPPDLVYRNVLDNRTWSAQHWQESMNGFYVCCGTNYVGTHCYVNRFTMRLFARGMLVIGLLYYFILPSSL